jgi:hypothetical protein
MPNHTDNYLDIELPTAHAEAVLKLLRNDKNQFSYEGVAPMPDLIRNTGSGLRTFDGAEHRSWYQNRDTNACRPFTAEEMAQLEEIGFSNWHDWSYANWGVKWDAYNHGDAVEIERNDYEVNKISHTRIEVCFVSPWGPPDVWYSRLKEKFSELDPGITSTLSYRLADDPAYPHEL